MNFTISSLDLEAFESLPPHTRRCVFWEVDPTFTNAAPTPCLLYTSDAADE